jgi:hypothetical protein
MKKLLERLPNVTLETWTRLAAFVLLSGAVLLLMIGCNHLGQTLETRPTLITSYLCQIISYEKAKPGLQAGAATSEQNYREIRELVIQIDQHNAVCKQRNTQ